MGWAEPGNVMGAEPMPKGAPVGGVTEAWLRAAALRRGRGSGRGPADRAQTLSS
jgi:hypothetical protein